MTLVLVSMDVTWVRVLKNRGRGLGSISRRSASFLSFFAFFCISGLRFLPNDTLRAEGFRLLHSMEKKYAKDIFHSHHCDYVVDMRGTLVW